MPLQILCHISFIFSPNIRHVAITSSHVPIKATQAKTTAAMIATSAHTGIPKAVAATAKAPVTTVATPAIAS